MFDQLKKMLGKDSSKRNRTILVVDDNPLDRKLIQKTLETIGYSVITANDGREGFDAAMSQKPDLILSDCNMPEMNGVEMCKRLVEREQTQEIPFIFLTSEDTPKNVVDCFELGAHGHMVKPINPKILQSQIDGILKEYLK